MKKIYLPSLLALTIIATVFTSCRSGRAYYAQPAPRYHSSVALIIRPNSRIPDGYLS